METRGIQLWALCIPITLGLVWNIVYRHILCKIKLKKSQFLIIFVVIGLSIGYGRICADQFKPIIPYKMVNGSLIDGYLKVTENVKPTDWTIVYSGEGIYALVLGKEFNTMLSVFLEKYKPDKNVLDEANEIPVNVLLFYQKNVFRTDFENLQESYNKIEEDNEKLLQWINKYKAKFDNISVFYENENLLVYYIKRNVDKDEETKKIWGG